MLELQDIDLRQTRFYQEVFAEGEAQAEQQPRQTVRWLAKGKT
jgi:predicted transposase YdaD